MSQLFPFKMYILYTQYIHIQRPTGMYVQGDECGGMKEIHQNVNAYSRLEE